VESNSRLKYLEERFRQVISAINSPNQETVNQSSVGQPFRLVNHKDCSFSLSGEDADLYNDLIQEILDTKDWQKKFSEKYVTNTVNEIFSQVLSESGQNNLSEHIEELDRHYSEYSAQKVVYLPVRGIWMEIEELKVGNVNFIQSGEYIFEKIISQAEPVIYSTLNTSEEKDEILRSLREELSEYFSMNKGNVIAEVSFVAEPTRAKELAEEEVRRSLEVLKFFIPLETILKEPKDKIQIGLEGEVISGVRYSISLAQDNVSTNLNITGGMACFSLNRENIEIMSESGFMTLSELLSKENLNPYEEVLLRAIHWFSAARMQIEPENALLNLITSIEVILTPRDGNPIGTSLAEGLALLLASGFKVRKRIKTRFKKIYQNRSAVSHGGKKKVSDDDLLYLIHVTYSLLVILCKRVNEFQTHELLFIHIEELKLS
jgi:hypothetical protein